MIASSPVRVHRRTAMTAIRPCVLQHPLLSLAGTDPPHSWAQPAVMGQFLSDDFRRVDADPLQQLPDRHKHPRSLSSRYPDRNLAASSQHRANQGTSLTVSLQIVRWSV